MVRAIKVMRVRTVSLFWMDIRCHPFVSVSRECYGFLKSNANLVMPRRDIEVCATHPHHISEMTRNLQTGRHIASLSSSRQPVLLVLIRDQSIRGAPCRTLFVQGESIMSSRMCFDGALFDNDTVFLGEVIRIGKDILYLVDDLLVLQGTHLVDTSSLQQRHTIVLDILRRGYWCDAIFDDVQVSLKGTCLPHDLSPLLSLASKLPYVTRYLTLRPLSGRGRVYHVPINTRSASRSHTVTTLAPVETIALVHATPTTAVSLTSASRKETMMRVSETGLPDVYEVTDPDTGVRSIACLPTISLSRMMRGVFTRARGVDHVRIRCRFNISFEKWEPMGEQQNENEEQDQGQEQVGQSDGSSLHIS